MLCTYDAAPADVRAQTQRVTDAARAAFGASLVTVTLHGSLAMGCFNPAGADIDVLVVVSDSAGARAFWDALLHVPEQPEIELSVVRARDLDPFVHPTPYVLHHSNATRAQPWEPADLLPVDPDIAAHVVIALARGITLAGEPLGEITRGVPLAAWVDSIVRDTSESRGVRRGEDAEYAVLNLCRTFRFLLDTFVGSKVEGGTWALDVVPSEQRAVVQRALASYEGDGNLMPWDSSVDECVDWIGARIDQLAAVRGYR